MEENQMSRRPRRASPAQKNRSRQGVALAILLCVTILVFSLAGWIAKDREFSENENRSLAQKPELSWNALKDGSYLSDLSSYLADQFPGRDMWLSVNLGMHKLLGAKESGGVYLGADNYLLQVPGDPNEAQLSRNLAAMEEFAERYPELNVVASIVPNAVTVIEENLPPNAPVRDQKEDLRQIKGKLRGVKFVDVTDTLEAHDDEQLYYRTDHHWTSLAAAYSFGKLASSFEITPPTLSSYGRYVVSTTFEGTLASKSGSHKAQDTVEIFVPKTDIEYFVEYPDSSDRVCSMYKAEALDTKDHYTVFFGGNYSRVDITTTADTERCLLVFKDSYANCMLQFLYPYFDHITMIDPRYYYDNVAQVISSESITDVLYLYNLDTFLSDTSLADTLAIQ